MPEQPPVRIPIRRPTVGWSRFSINSRTRRAAASVVLNIGESAYSQGGNRTARFHSAAGSASETRSGLQLAGIWGYVDSQQAEKVDAILDRILGMLWGLTHRK